MANEAIQAVVAGAGGRRLAAGEWGLRVDDVGGWPLDVGVRLRRGVLRAQAFVAGAGALDETGRLGGNRGRWPWRFGPTAAGAGWLVGRALRGHVDKRSVD